MYQYITMWNTLGYRPTGFLPVKTGKKPVKWPFLPVFYRFFFFFLRLLPVSGTPGNTLKFKVIKKRRKQRIDNFQTRGKY